MPMPGSERILTLRVARIDRLTDAVSQFDLVGAHGPRLPAPEPGSHVDLHLPGGFQRSYSIAEAPHRAGWRLEADGRATVSRYRLGIQLDPASRGGSRSAHQRLRVGDLVPVGAPRCAFPMPPGRGPLMLLAGGIGLTPLLAMAQQAVHQGRPLALHAFARRADALAFSATLAEPALAAVTVLHLDDRLAASGRTPRDVLAGLIGQPPPACPRGASPPAGAACDLAYCGPPGFMATIRALAAAHPQHWSPERLHAEHFAPPPPAPGEREAAVHGQPFRLRLVRQGVELDVAAGQTAVQALHDLGVQVPVSCQQGVCGTCVVGWMAAEGAAVPMHRDHCLSAAERAHRVALCCAGASSADRPLQLDL